MEIVAKKPAPSLRLREIVGSNGEGVITDWLALEAGARAKFHVRVGDLKLLPRTDWNRKQFHKLKDADGICEIKWKSGDKQWCALGFDKDDHFVMLVGCTHKDGNYDPRNCIETAKKRKSECEKGTRGIIDYQE